MNEPTDLTQDDVDKTLEKIMSTDVSVSKCCKRDVNFLPNYSLDCCDECFFKQFPKKEVEKYCLSIIED